MPGCRSKRHSGRAGERRLMNAAKKWSCRSGLNTRPAVYKSAALPTELQQHMISAAHALDSPRALGSPRVGESCPEGTERGRLLKRKSPAPFAVPNRFPLHACDKAAQRILLSVWCRRIPASQIHAQRILRGSKAKQESCGESPNQPDRLTNFNPMLLYNLHEVRRNEHFPLAFLFALWYCTTSKGVRFCEHPGPTRSKGGEGSRNATIPPLTSSQPNPMLERSLP